MAGLRGPTSPTWVKLPKKWEVYTERILTPEQRTRVVPRLKDSLIAEPASMSVRGSRRRT